MMQEGKCPLENQEPDRYYGDRINYVDKEYCDSFLKGEGCKHKNECETYHKLT